MDQPNSPPLQRQVNDPDPSGSGGVPPPRPLIMAVDDEIDDVFFLRHLIKRTGRQHRFQHFSNGDAAVSALTGMLAGESHLPFPLVCVLDIKMTGMTGFDVLHWIRGESRLDSLPVIMFSGSDDPRDLDNARELGAQCYVKKFPSAEVMQQLLQEAENFAALAPPKRVFLQWHYRFIGGGAPRAPSLA